MGWREKFDENRDRLRRCHNCTWSHQPGPDNMSLCHKRAPTRPEQQPNTTVDPWPDTGTAGWCGDWEPVKTTPDPVEVAP